MRRTPCLAALLALAACPAPAPPEEDHWQVVLEELPGALLRVWGTSAQDVYAVGGDGDGQGSLMLHYDGSTWRRIDTGTQGDLWWIDRVGEDDLRIVGEGGLVLRYRPSTGAFERRTPPDALTLYGAWGSSPSDVWYVGGDPSLGKGVVYRDDGNTIAPPSPALTATASLVLFKVHGFAPGDVWLVGQGGLTVHWDGQQLTQPSAVTTQPLLTAHGPDPAHLYAVGGFAEGVMLAWDGAAWRDETPPETPGLNGVYATAGGKVVAAGFNGQLFERGGDGTWTVLMGNPSYQDLHSVWIDEQGGIWSAGGQLASNPPKRGVLVHYGKSVSTTFAR